MSNYLNNLAARTLNLTPVVQPRLASLFEHVPVAGGNAKLASTESDAIPASELPESSNHRPSSVRSIGSEVDKTSEATDSDLGHRDVGKINSRTGNDADQRTVNEFSNPKAAQTTQRINEPIDRSPISKQERADFTSLRIATDGSDDNHATAFTYDDGDDSENGSRRRTIGLPGESGFFNQTRDRDSNNRDRTQPSIVEPAQGSRRSIALVPPDSLSIGPVRREFAGSSLVNESPIIKVTIGRVDVRAVFAQPSAPRVNHTKQPAAMSLNEYLKQRNEGHR